MCRILIIHPEGNIVNNLNLYGITELLVESGYLVDYWYHEDKRIPKIEIPGVRFLSKTKGTFKELLNVQKHGEYALIIGIDRGIIPAHEIACMLNLPYGYISYEIFFADETSRQYKAPEIAACAETSFAVVQDNKRADLLAEENHISREKMVILPVGYRSGVCRVKKNIFLHDRLSIPHEKKICLLMGGVNAPNGVDKLLVSINTCPDDWCLVLHDRYGEMIDLAPYAGAVRNKKLFQSQEQFTCVQDAELILASADVGFAFYCPQFTSKYNGKNIQYIGMASGKIALFLQHGIPVISNITGEMAEFIGTHKVGEVIKYVSQVWDILPRQEWHSLSYNCVQFFDAFLDLDKTSTSLLKQIKKITTSREIVS